jgi:hypothetical protein
MTTPAPPSRRWFRFLARLNRPLTTKTFDEAVDGMFGRLLNILRFVVVAQFSVLFWMVLSGWGFSLYVATLVVFLLARARRRRTASLSVRNALPAPR